MNAESFWVIRPFNPVFITVFAFFLLLLIGSSLLLRRKSERTRRIVLVAACLVTLAGFFVYKYCLSIDKEYDVAYASMGGFNWWSELPLHLCNINMILIPVAVLTKRRPLMSFCFFLGPLGATLALVMPGMGFGGYSLLLPRMLGYYGTHFMIVIEALAIVCYGLYRPSFRDLPRTLLTIAAVGLVIFGIDVLLRTTGLGPKANYFFAMESEGNPVLDIFHGLIPLPYLYLLPCLPIIGVYMAIIILPFHLTERRGENAGREQKQPAAAGAPR